MPEKTNFYPPELCTFKEYPKIKEFIQKFSELDAIQKYYTK